MKKTQVTSISCSPIKRGSLKPLKLTPRQIKSLSQSKNDTEQAIVDDVENDEFIDGFASGESSPSSAPEQVPEETVTWGVRDLDSENSVGDDKISLEESILGNGATVTAKEALSKPKYQANRSPLMKRNQECHLKNRPASSTRKQERRVVRVGSKVDAAAVISQLRLALSASKKSNTTITLGDFNRLVTDCSSRNSARSKSAREPAVLPAAERPSTLSSEDSCPSKACDQAFEEAQGDDSFFSEMAKIAQKQALTKVEMAKKLNRSLKSCPPQTMAAKLGHQNGSTLSDSEDECETAPSREVKSDKANLKSSVNVLHIPLQDPSEQNACMEEKTRSPPYEQSSRNEDHHKAWINDCKISPRGGKQRVRVKPSRDAFASDASSTDLSKFATSNIECTMEKDRRRAPKMPYSSSLLVKSRKKRNDKGCTF